MTERESSNLPYSYKSRLCEEFQLEGNDSLKNDWFSGNDYESSIPFDKALNEWVQLNRVQWRLERKNIINFELNSEREFVEVSTGATESKLVKKVFLHEDLPPSRFSRFSVKENSDITVLLVVNDHFNQLFFKDFLGGYDFRVDAVATHEEAVATFDAKKHSIVIVDVHLSTTMFRREGFEIMKAINASSCEGATRMIAISDETDGFTKELCLQYGCDFFFEKPIILDDLVDVLCDCGYLNEEQLA